MNIPKVITCIFSIIYVINLFGCVNDVLQYKKHEIYKEHVSYLLVSENHKHLVIVGKKHHYVFDANEVLINSLYSEFRKSVRGIFYRVNINNDNSIFYHISLYIDKNSPELDKKKQSRQDTDLDQMGF